MRTLCSSHPRLALVGTLTCRSRRNHAQLSGTCETRKSSRTSSTPAHVAQLAAESETDPLHQRVQAVDTTSPSYCRPPGTLVFRLSRCRILPPCRCSAGEISGNLDSPRCPQQHHRRALLQPPVLSQQCPLAHRGRTGSRCWG